MRPFHLLIVVALSSIIAGCAAPQKYSWGNYERSLYSYYKDPEKAAELTEELEEAIQEAETKKRPVAPGLYAEYGFMLLQQGKSKEAVEMFEKEKAKWPEATYLMNSMIRVASNQSKKLTQSKE